MFKTPTDIHTFGSRCPCGRLIKDCPWFNNQMQPAACTPATYQLQIDAFKAILSGDKSEMTEVGCSSPGVYHIVFRGVQLTMI